MTAAKPQQSAGGNLSLDASLSPSLLEQLCVLSSSLHPFIAAAFLCGCPLCFQHQQLTLWSQRRLFREDTPSLSPRHLTSSCVHPASWMCSYRYCKNKPYIKSRQVRGACLGRRAVLPLH